MMMSSGFFGGKSVLSLQINHYQPSDTVDTATARRDLLDSRPNPPHISGNRNTSMPIHPTQTVVAMETVFGSPVFLAMILVAAAMVTATAVMQAVGLFRRFGMQHTAGLGLVLCSERKKAAKAAAKFEGESPGRRAWSVLLKNYSFSVWCPVKLS